MEALLTAIKEGDTLWVNKIIGNKHFNIDESNEKGMSALLLASKMGEFDVVKLLLEKGAQVDLQSNTGRSALISASEMGHFKVAQLLLENGALVDLQNNTGRSALMHACENRHAEVVKLLLEKGAQVDLKCNRGWTALMHTSGYWKNKEEIFHDLQEKDHLSASSGQYEVSKWLLEKGVPVGIPALTYALKYSSGNGYCEIAKLLLENGAQVDVQSAEGQSALMYACKEGNYEVASLLVEEGANLSLEDSKGESVLTGAEYMRHFRAEECHLRNLSSNPSDNTPSSDNKGDKLFLNSPEKGSSDDELSQAISDLDSSHTLRTLLSCVPSALERGTDSIVDSAPLKTGENDLFSACKQGQYEVAKSLLEKRSHVNFQDSDGWTALMFACQEGHLQVAKLLLENNAMVDLQNSEGWSALMLACREGHYEVSKLLIEYRAKINLQSLKWESAYGIAILHENPKMTPLLEESRSEQHSNDEDSNSLAQTLSEETLGTEKRSRNSLEESINLGQHRDDEDSNPFQTQSEETPGTEKRSKNSLEEHRDGEDSNPSVQAKTEQRNSLEGVNETQSEGTPGNEWNKSLMEPLQAVTLNEDVPLSLNTLTLLKWKDAKGHQCDFRLVNHVSADWRKFGIRFGHEENQLRSIYEECYGKADRCWCTIMNQWMENAGTLEYPATWGGLHSVLVDLEHKNVAELLRKVLASVIRPSPPQAAVTPPDKSAVTSAVTPVVTLPTQCATHESPYRETAAATLALTQHKSPPSLNWHCWRIINNGLFIAQNIFFLALLALGKRQ